MSETLFIKDEIYALCEKAGLDPKSVGSIDITPEQIRFEVFIEPKQVGADGPLTVYVHHPWDLV